MVVAVGMNLGTMVSFLDPSLPLDATESVISGLSLMEGVVVTKGQQTTAVLILLECL